MDSSRYSFSLTTFSPSGKLVQIEYALQAVGAGSTSIGIKTKDGVVIATEKKLPTLMDETTIQKIQLITENIGIIYAGMGTDYRVLVSKGRKIAERYFRTYRKVVPLIHLVRELAFVMQEYTQSGGVRPFGVSLLVAGWDVSAGFQLYQIDPSGSYWAWKASAIGKQMKNAKTFLEKRYSKEMNLDDAIHTAVMTLKENFDGEMTENNVEIGVVELKEGVPLFRILPLDEAKEYCVAQ